MLGDNKHFASLQESTRILADLSGSKLGLELPGTLIRSRDLNPNLVIQFGLVDSVTEPAEGVRLALDTLGLVLAELTQRDHLGLNLKLRDLLITTVIILALTIDLDFVQQTGLAQQTVPESL